MEYYVVRRGHYRLSDLYTTERDGWYWYTYGINFRAYAAYISGILINVVGFAGASESQLLARRQDDADSKIIAGASVPLAATRVYQMSFFTGFGTRDTCSLHDPMADRFHNRCFGDGVPLPQLDKAPRWKTLFVQRSRHVRRRQWQWQEFPSLRQGGRKGGCLYRPGLNKDTQNDLQLDLRYTIFNISLRTNSDGW